MALLGLPAVLAQLVGGSVHPLPREASAETPRPSAPVSLALQHPTICDSSVRQYSGYVKTATNGTEYFFWLFESRGKPETDPLVMYLEGGPACSSMVPLLIENGPCSIVSKDGAFTAKNPYSWNNKASVMWVDQPAGVGYSTGLPTTHNETQVADNMYSFLQALFASEELSKFAKNPFFVFGHSFAGHYVPAVAHRIWQGNKNTEGLAINLQGIGIGNGWVDPFEQFKTYPQMAYDGGRSEGGSLAHGAINNSITLAAMRAAVVPCTAAIAKCNAGWTTMCTAANYICALALAPYMATGLSFWDMRKPCEHPPLCFDISPMVKFLNSTDVRKQLGVSKAWGMCNKVAAAQLKQDYARNYHTLLPDMLASGIRVLIFSGDVDWACNWLGGKKWVLALEWPHKGDFNAAADEPYTMPGWSAAAGRLRSAGGLSFLQIYQAGHFAIMDQPEVALDMLNSFLADTLDERTRLSALTV